MYSTQKKMTKKKNNKQSIKFKKKLKNFGKQIPLLFNEAYWRCSKLLHLHKKVGR
jgi:hypothetical protein